MTDRLKILLISLMTLVSFKALFALSFSSPDTAISSRSSSVFGYFPSRSLQLYHSATGQSLIVDPQTSPLVFLSTPCKPCQRLVKEITKTCPEVQKKLRFIGVGSRSQLKEAFPKLKDSLWLTNQSIKDLKINGTPTFLFQETNILGSLNCTELLKQTSLFKGF